MTNSVDAMRRFVEDLAASAGEAVAASDLRITTAKQSAEHRATEFSTRSSSVDEFIRSAKSTRESNAATDAAARLADFAKMTTDVNASIAGITVFRAGQSAADNAARAQADADRLA
ncbi:MAG: hypothetical protein ACOYEV_16215, partial [Candidatus Nanopelagicales bacterium]